MINKSKLINLSLLLMIFIAFSCNKDDDFEPETENIEQQEVFQEFWDIYDRYYPLFPRKNIDWQVVYNTYSPQVTETQQFSACLTD